MSWEEVVKMSLNICYPPFSVLYPAFRVVHQTSSKATSSQFDSNSIMVLFIPLTKETVVHSKFTITRVKLKFPTLDAEKLTAHNRQLHSIRLAQKKKECA